MLGDAARKREAQAGYGPPSRRPSSRCQTARPAASSAQRISFPRRIFCARVVASLFFVSTASLLPWPALRRSAGRRTTLIRRAGKTRPHACEACPSRATGTSASRRSTVALPGPRCVSGISAGAGARLARRPSFMAGYGPRVRPRLRAAADATPRSAVRIVSGDALMSEDDKSYTIYSLRSQDITAHCRRRRASATVRYAPSAATTNGQAFGSPAFAAIARVTVLLARTSPSSIRTIQSASASAGSHVHPCPR
jgi:hypothetical protein